MVQQSAELLLGRARLFVSPAWSPAAGSHHGETGYRQGSNCARFKKIFQVISIENIIMKSVDMKFSLEQLLQGAGQCLQIFIYHNFNLSKQ